MNKKGFTLVETLVSFTLIAIVSIFLFQIVMIIKNIYVEKGVKTQLAVEQATISNVINKDLYNLTSGSTSIIGIEKKSPTEVLFSLSDGSTRELKVDQNSKKITYNNITQKFLSNSTIGDIEVKYEYDSSASLIYNGIASVTIPVSYNGYSNTFNVVFITRYNIKNTIIAG